MHDSSTSEGNGAQVFTSAAQNRENIKARLGKRGENVSTSRFWYLNLRGTSARRAMVAVATQLIVTHIN